jgi:hypothetical protein
LRSVEEDIKAHIFKAFTNKLFVSYALIETIANWCYINQVLIWQMTIDKIVALKRASFFIRPVKSSAKRKDDIHNTAEATVCQKLLAEMAAKIAKNHPAEILIKKSRYSFT